VVILAIQMRELRKLMEAAVVVEEEDFLELDRGEAVVRVLVPTRTSIRVDQTDS